ncbi:MAG: hypothetical protein CMJ82_11420 [Planctomycetaceae bacterium]|nr:hypothetical protein [Planctomycetaceae bacterium]
MKTLFRLFCLAVSCACLVLPAMAQQPLAIEGDQKSPLTGEPTAGQLEFFEKRIRPVLVEHCYKCHSQPAAKKDELRGGLLLDSRAGLLAGGESGEAIVPGKPDEGTLLGSLNYDLYEMPPSGKLPAAVIEDFRTWIEMGAVDPREGGIVQATAIDIEAGRDFWAYRPVSPGEIPNHPGAKTPIDAYIGRALRAAGVKPVGQASRQVLIRRLYYDLLGIPPTPEQIEAFIESQNQDAYELLVDQLLESPRFGERWGRHWLDVVRYAESVTLRGLIYEQAWRYRDYVIESFNDDVPVDVFIRQQIAGDLLESDDYQQQRRNLIATGYLAMGNNNLEDQDKAKLRMDAVDEQLETIGRGLLGQTIGCARCHDHKFDPIPTKDYYALAGILRNTESIVNANVGKWVESELPLPQEKLEAARQVKDELALVKSELAKLTKDTNVGVIGLDAIVGVVLDDTDAVLVGNWNKSTSNKTYVGPGYQYASGGAANTSATFEPQEELSGVYEVRFAYAYGSNRPKKLQVEVWDADGLRVAELDETTVPSVDGHFDSLGTYRFEKGMKPRVVVDTSKSSSGAVVIDAVQFLSEEQVARESKKVESEGDQQAVASRVKELEVRARELEKLTPPKEIYMTVREQKEIADTQVHIRGDVHNLGDDVPRGFLQVATYGAMPSISQGESGRVELGQWITSESNPLTSRVFANRVWGWLMGVGLVRTPDNFGVTGESPSHPELLDYLASQLKANGWSTKQLIREIVLSATYQRVSDPSDELKNKDPENRLLGHMNRRRMDAESILDAMLSVSGKLDLRMGGPTIKSGTKNDYNYPHQGYRRAVYWPAFRNSLPEIFQVFDYPNPSVVVGRRDVSSTSPQALFMLNNPRVMEYCKLAAERYLAMPEMDDEARMRLVSMSILGRKPTPREVAISLSYVQQAQSEEDRLQNWSRVIQAVFATVDFRYIN